MDVGDGVLDSVARADDRHAVALAHGCPTSDAEGAQVEEGDRVAVDRLDRQRPASARDRSGEGDAPGCGSAHGGSGRGGDVDAPMQATTVGVVAEQEWS